MAFGTVARQPEGGVFGYRFGVTVTGDAALLIGMAVGKAVLVTPGASAIDVVRVPAIGTEMLARCRMADIANTGYLAAVGTAGGRSFLGIVTATKILGKDNPFFGLGSAEDAVSGRGYFLLDHIDIVVTMSIMAIPAELATLPCSVDNRIGPENR